VQFMGKDNVPFHTVIFPATLLGTQASRLLRHCRPDGAVAAGPTHLHLHRYCSLPPWFFPANVGACVAGMMCHRVTQCGSLCPSHMRTSALVRLTFPQPHFLVRRSPGR